MRDVERNVSALHKANLEGILFLSSPCFELCLTEIRNFETSSNLPGQWITGNQSHTTWMAHSSSGKSMCAFQDGFICLRLEIFAARAQPTQCEVLGTLNFGGTPAFQGNQRYLDASLTPRTPPMNPMNFVLVHQEILETVIPWGCNSG